MGTSIIRSLWSCILPNWVDKREASALNVAFEATSQCPANTLT